MKLKGALTRSQRAEGSAFKRGQGKVRDKVKALNTEQAQGAIGGAANKRGEKVEVVVKLRLQEGSDSG